jgi:16S rRNA (guanine527-N7)-methyltransferase
MLRTVVIVINKALLCFISTSALQCFVAMTPDQVNELLAPFLEGETLSDTQLRYISQHLDLLLKWNHRINLTAINESEQILTRHFGESLFTARKLSQDPAPFGSLIDLGSGSGFPGIPIKIWVPELTVTLVESRQKKATFLREVARTLGLDRLEVANQRAEKLALQADVVTIRAVEKFEESLSVAASLVKNGGRLVLLIGSPQVQRAISLQSEFSWDRPIPIPLSVSRVVLIGGALL